MTTATLPVLTAKDFTSDQDVRWCPGCGDYAILAQMRKVLSKTGATRENTVFVSGIGCSSRFPYYMETYGFHTIHGRAPGFATGVKLANPKLEVWMVTGDGDGLSIGGNHLMHLLRRNIGIKVLLFNNQIYGLTKSQYSPTSEEGKKTPSTPMGSIDMPVRPTSVAMGSEASFVARTVDVDKSIGEVLERASAHVGSAFVEIYQDCNVFNHKAFEYATDRGTKEDHLLRLEAGKPMIFGTNRDQGLFMNEQGQISRGVIGKDVGEDRLLIHDETNETLAFMLTRLKHPQFPEPLGVIYAVHTPTYEEMLDAQIEKAIGTRGKGTIHDMLFSGEIYEVAERGPSSKHGLHESA